MMLPAARKATPAVTALMMRIGSLWTALPSAPASEFAGR